jgi:hypothetical protein
MTAKNSKTARRMLKNEILPQRLKATKKKSEAFRQIKSSLAPIWCLSAFVANLKMSFSASC